MNPAARLCAALLIGLVLWLPTLAATLRGDVDLIQAAVRYLIGLVLVRLAVGGLASLIHTYSAGGGQDAAAMEDRQLDESTSSVVGAS